jgi:hypothetical protein
MWQIPILHMQVVTAENFLTKPDRDSSRPQTNPILYLAWFSENHSLSLLHVTWSAIWLSSHTTDDTLCHTKETWWESQEDWIKKYMKRLSEKICYHLLGPIKFFRINVSVSWTDQTDKWHSLQMTISTDLYGNHSALSFDVCSPANTNVSQAF